MGYKCGIVGMPNVGKSTLYNALTGADVPAANYPFCTIDPNIGYVGVADDRLSKIADIVGVSEIVPATLEFVDIAGLVKGASRGEGLGNRFLAHVREMDAIAHVVGLFDSDGPLDEASMLDQIDIVRMELVLADLETVQRAIARTVKRARTGDKEQIRILNAFKRAESALEQGLALRQIELSAQEKEDLRDLFLVTAKPVFYVLNIAEDQIDNIPSNLETKVEGPVVAVCARLEAELVALEDEIESTKAKIAVQQADLSELSAKFDEQDADFMENFAELMKLDAEIEELKAEFELLDEAETEAGEMSDFIHAGSADIIGTGYELLGLRTFFTFNDNEVRAWTIKEGTMAQRAAGLIHTDMEKGFIRAEVMSYEQLAECGDVKELRNSGNVRFEGKSYEVREGDILQIKFR